MARFVVLLVLPYFIAHCLAAATSCGAVAVLPKPTHLVCGGHGEVKSPSPLQPAFAVSDEVACADECELTEHCVSFGYNATTQTSCQLYSRAVIGQQYRHRKQDLGAKYSHWRCFKCTSDCNIRNPIYSSLMGQQPDTASAFCSDYLGYPSLTTTTVPETTTDIEVSSTTLPDSTTTTSTTTTTTSTTTSSTTTTTTSTTTITTPSTSITTTYTYQLPNRKIKRDKGAESTSAACSCVVDPSTSTVTSTDTSTTTTTTTATAGPTSTVTSTDIDTLTTVTTTIQTSTSSSITSTTTTTVLVSTTSSPAICNAAGLPKDHVIDYNRDYNSSPASCIASCKSDAQCLSTGGYYVTDGGPTTYTCRKYSGTVTDSADLGSGYYTFNDKACP